MKSPPYLVWTVSFFVDGLLENTQLSKFLVQCSSAARRWHRRGIFLRGAQDAARFRKRERMGRFYAMYGSQKSPSIAFLLLPEQMFFLICRLFPLPARSSASSLPILTAGAELIPPPRRTWSNHGSQFLSDRLCHQSTMTDGQTISFKIQ